MKDHTKKHDDYLQYIWFVFENVADPKEYYKYDEEIILIQLFTMVISNIVKQKLLILLLIIIVLKVVMMMILLIVQEIMIMRNYFVYSLKNLWKDRTMIR